MQPFKLPAMPKKVFKLFIKTNFLTPSKTFYFFKFSSRDKYFKSSSRKLFNWCRDLSLSQTFRARMLLSKQAYPLSQRNNQLILRKKDALYSHQKFFNVLWRYLNVSSTVRKLDQLAKSFWKGDFSQTLRSHQSLVRRKSDLSDRSLRSNQLLTTNPNHEKQMKHSYDKLNQKDEFGNVFKRLAEQYNGSAEQKLYTESDLLETKRKRSESSFRIIQESSVFGKRSPTDDLELPPPRRCRLSCPLPPPEFAPRISKEFQPNRQPPSVKFSSQPAEFLPPKKPSKETEYYYLKTTIQPKATLTSNILKTAKTKQYSAKRNQLKPKTYEHEPESLPKMKALLFEPDTLALHYNKVDAPTRIHKDEVVVQVIYSGVCGTDMSILDGKMPSGGHPIILGHEISGKVYAVGSDVYHVKPGDYVAVNPYTSCGLCRYCTRGLFSSCVNEGLDNSIGVSKNGGWAEFVVLKRAQLYKLFEDVSLEQAALLQPLACILSAMSKLNITNGLVVLIQGLGLAGCLWASVLHSKGHKNVFVCEKNEYKKQRFHSLNLGYALVPPEDIGQYCADVIIECSGSALHIEKALQILNPNGQICFFGKPNPSTEVRCLPYDIVKKEITIVGNAGNTLSFSKAIDLVAAMGDRYLHFNRLGIHIFNLEDYLEAFQMKKTGEVGKVMFKFES